MTDPYRRLSTSLSALEEFQKRQSLMDQIFKPSALERAMADAARASDIMDRLGRFSTVDAAMRAALGQGFSAQLAEQAALGLTATKFMEEQARLLELTRTPAYQSLIEQAAKGAALFEKQQKLLAGFERPLELERLSGIAAAQVRAWEFLPERPWESIMAERMGRLDVRWALSGAVDASAEAFGRLGRLADVARYATPYFDETAEAVVADLGTPTVSPEETETVEEREDRYDDAGRDRELIAFPPTGYPHIMISAGFAVSFPEPPAILPVSGLIETVTYSPETGRLLQSLEGHLRVFVAGRLEAEAGSRWLKQRVPHEVRQAWQGRAEEARAIGKPVFPLINYANFMDLCDIIARKDNWPLFGSTFQSRENLQMSMLRLYGIRNDFAHSRPISMTDILVATTESTMLFRALGFGVRYDG